MRWSTWEMREPDITIECSSSAFSIVTFSPIAVYGPM